MMENRLILSVVLITFLTLSNVGIAQEIKIIVSDENTVVSPDSISVFSIDNVDTTVLCFSSHHIAKLNTGVVNSLLISYKSRDFLIPEFNSKTKGIHIVFETGSENGCYTISSIHGDVIRTGMNDLGDCERITNIYLYQVSDFSITNPSIKIRKKTP